MSIRGFIDLYSTLNQPQYNIPDHTYHILALPPPPPATTTTTAVV